MPKFRKRPVEVEAVLWAGENWDEMREFLGVPQSAMAFLIAPDEPSPLVICTLEGNMTADIGDWIIRGVANEYYPCKPDIFEKTYEAV